MTNAQVNAAVKAALAADFLDADIETFSESDLSSVGVYKYAEHESTEILCFGYRFSKDPRAVYLWIPFDNVPAAIVDEVKRRALEKLARTPKAETVYFENEGEQNRWAIEPFGYTLQVRLGVAVPRELREHIERGGEVRAYNAQFERVVLNGTAGKKLNFPHISIEQTVCVAAKSAAAGLPRALEDSAEHLGTHPKDKSGSIAMKQITKPRKPTKDGPSTRWTWENGADKFIDTYVYNVDDVLAEAGVDEVLPELTSYEQEVYQLDQRINQRGIQVDIEAIHNVIAIREEYKRFLELAMEKATRPVFGALDCCPTCSGTKRVEKILRKKPTGVFLECENCRGLKPTQREQVADWIRTNGFPDLLDMQAETVKLLVERTDVPDRVKHVLRIYSTYNAKAPMKFDAILEAVCADGRVRGMFIFHGAGTGRWSSVIVQFQNLFRPVIDDPETAVEAFRSRSLELIKALYAHDPMKVIASTVRSHLVAAPGKKFICLDYSGVESRMNAWLWGEQWKLEAFRLFDQGKGPDLYRIAYGNAFNVDPTTISKGDYRRQLGKVIDLFGQYEGGVGAFVNLAEQYGVDLDDMADKVYHLLPEDVLESAAWMWNKFGRGSELSERVYMACDGVKQLWRRSHPATVNGWVELKAAAELAAQHPGKVYPVAGGKGLFKVQANEYGHSWLCLLLPSRRRMIRYYKPEWTPEKTVTVFEKNRFSGVTEEVERTIPGELHVMGVDTKTRRYMRHTAYGGMWNNNFVQGSCADLLRGGVLGLDRAGYPLVLTVHDEGGAEVEETFGSVAAASEIFCAREPWFDGLPLVAEGWEGRRYRK